MKGFFNTVLSTLNQDTPVIMVTIIRHSGSTPRGAGSRMAVRPDGSIMGTIGGGLVEEMARQQAVSMFQGPALTTRSFELSNNIAAVSDMICGGDLEVLLERISPAEETRTLLETLITEQDLGHQGVLVTTMTGDIPARTLIMASGKRMGNLDIPENILAKIKKSPPTTPHILQDKDRSLFVEPLDGRTTLYLLGAGHVSRPTCEIGKILGMRVVVMDDRPDFANKERFPGADHIEVLENFSHCFATSTLTEHSYIVIVTRGHSHDKTVLQQALKTPAGYIGMIGSSRKKKAIYDALLAEGVPQNRLDTVYSPIGIAIGSQTPEEIAVAIMAEIIQHRAGQKK